MPLNDFSCCLHSLSWPGEVVRQWLWDHDDNDSFLADYASLDLSLITWNGYDGFGWPRLKPRLSIFAETTPGKLRCCDDR